MEWEDGGDKVVVEEAGVELTKAVAETDAGFPVLVVTLRSTRADPVNVRLTEAVPESIDAPDIVFHPDYGRAHWSKRMDTLSFECPLAGQDTYMTIYGHRAGDRDAVRAFLTAPESVEVVEVGTPTAAGETAQTPPRGFARGGSAASQPDGFGTANGSPDQVPPPADDPVESVETSEDPLSASEGPRQGTAEPTPPNTVLLDALAAELQDGEITAEHKAAFQRLLAAESGAGPLEARVARLQADVADLRAYTGALERFLTEHGSGEAFVEHVEQRLDAIDDEMATLRATVTEHGDTLDRLETDQEKRDAAVDQLEARIAEHDTRLAELAADLEAIGADLDDHDIPHRIAELEEDLQEVQRTWQGIQSVFAETDQ